MSKSDNTHSNPVVLSKQMTPAELAVYTQSGSDNDVTRKHPSTGVEVDAVKDTQAELLNLMNELAEIVEYCSLGNTTNLDIHHAVKELRTLILADRKKQIGAVLTRVADKISTFTAKHDAPMRDEALAMVEGEINKLRDSK